MEAWLRSWTLLSGLNLRNPNGSKFNPANYTQFRNWLLNGNATNFAYMLSVQLAAMELNVEGGLVGGSALVYAPGAENANAQGFVTVTDLMSEANQALGVNNVDTTNDGIPDALRIFGGNPQRPYYEALKNALDKGNNNLNFVQPVLPGEQVPCAVPQSWVPAR